MSYLRKISVISPSQITSDQDDWNPSGLFLATVIRVDGDSGIRGITSITATYDGDMKSIVNVGSYPIYFPCEHPDGTAANRFTGSQDYMLLPSQIMHIVYDGTSSRWRVLFIKDILGQSVQKSLTYTTSSPSQTAANNPILGTSTGGGTVSSGSAIASSPQFPSYLSLGTSTSSTGKSQAFFAKNPLYISCFNKAHLTAIFVISIPTLSDGTNTFTSYCQITADNTVTTENPNNTIGVRYSSGINSGKFEAYSKDNSGSESTPVDLGITVAANTIYTIRIELDCNNTEARFYLDGGFAGRITTNLPADDTVCHPRIIQVKSVGSTNRILQLHTLYFTTTYP